MLWVDRSATGCGFGFVAKRLGVGGGARLSFDGRFQSGGTATPWPWAGVSRRNEGGYRRIYAWIPFLCLVLIRTE